MQIYKCECCGGSINTATFRCEYCGTQYKRDENDKVLRIETFQSPCQVLKSKIEIPMEHVELIGAQNSAKYLTERLVRNLADALAPYTKMEAEFDPRTNRQIVTATIRVVEPDYRF